MQRSGTAISRPEHRQEGIRSVVTAIRASRCRQLLWLCLAIGGGVSSRAGGEISGLTTGVFENLQGNASEEHSEFDVIASGMGTSQLNFGSAFEPGTSPNILRFTGTNIAATLNQEFTLGSLSFANGTTASGTSPDTVDFRLTLDQGHTSGVYIFTLDAEITPNGSTPEQDADYVHLTTPFADSTIWVDGEEYLLRMQFANPSSNGYLEASGFRVLEDSEATVDLIGLITTEWPRPVLGMSEPGTVSFQGERGFTYSLQVSTGSPRLWSFDGHPMAGDGSWLVVTPTNELPDRALYRLLVDPPWNPEP